MRALIPSLALILTLFGTSLPLFSEEISKKEAADKSQKEESSEDKSISPQKEENPEGKKESPSSPEKTEEKKLSQEEKDEAKERRLFPAVVFVRDVLNDKYPFTVDFGAEPGQYGSLIFGVFQYNFTDRFANRFEVGYNNEAKVDHAKAAAAEVSSTISRSVIIEYYPFVMYFGSLERDLNPLFRLDLGFAFRYQWYSYDYSFYDQDGLYFGSQSKGQYLTSRVKQDSYTFLPNISGFVELPFLKYFNLGMEVAVSPIYFTFGYTDLEINFADSSKNLFINLSSYSKHWSSPAVSTMFYIDILRYVRIKTRFDYNRIFQEQEEYDQAVIYSSFVWRYGIEIVKPQKSRKKSSHLWAGIYYQHNWSSDSINNDWSRTDGWIFCFGT